MPITLRDDSSIGTRNSPPAPKADVKQRQRMLVALGVLIVAVIVVFIKDRELWFAPPPGPEAEVNSQAVANPPGPAPPLPAAESTPAASTPAPAKKRPVQRITATAGDAPAQPVV